MDQIFPPPWEKQPKNTISINPEAVIPGEPPESVEMIPAIVEIPESTPPKQPLVMRTGDLTETLKDSFILKIPKKKPPKKHKKLSEDDGTILEFRTVPGHSRREHSKPSLKEKRRLARRTLENLTPKMLDRRNKFIAEYIKDWSGPLAAIRAGLPPSTALKMSGEYLREPYVAKRIWEYIDAAAEAELINRKRVLAMLVREANYTAVGASHGARVAALGKLATVLGMDQINVNVKGEVNHNVRGGVMLVPVVPDSVEWERMASGSQKLLKEEVRR